MSELTFGMRLSYDGKSANAGMDESRAKIDAMTAAGGKMASSYTGIDQAMRKHVETNVQTASSVNKLLDRYDPLGAKLRQLQADFKALDSAAAGGKIGTGEDARVDLVYANLQKQLAAASAGANAYAGAAGKAALSSGQLRMATQQLPLQFQDIWVSLAAGQSPMMVMMQQGSQIAGSFGGVGNAARAMGGYIMGLINPFTLATAAVAAGAAAWYAWGREAETAADKSVAAAEKIIAGMRATDSVYVLQRERDKIGRKLPVQWLSYDEKDLAKLDEDSQKLIAEYRKIDKLLKTEVARSTREWDGLHATDAERKAAELAREKQAYDEQVVLAKGKSDRLIELERQHQQKIAAINKSFEKKPSGDGRTESEKAFAEAWIETQRIISNVDPQAKAAAAWEYLLYLQATLGEQFPLTAEQMGQAYAKEMAGVVNQSDKAAAAMNKTWETFADNTQRTLSDVLYNGMNGQFNSIEDAFKQMLFRMAANAAAANLTEAMFGKKGSGGSSDSGWIGSIINWFASANGNAFGDGGVYAFANGGTFTNQLFNSPTPFRFAGGGGFNLGVMGEAGPEAVMPLSRGADGKLGVRAAGGGGAVFNDHSVTHIHIDSRADRAQILADVNQLVDNKQAKFAERMRRGTA